MKNVQIPGELWYLLVRRHLLDHDDPEELDRIKKLMESKLESLVKHQLYTTSKTDPDPETREKARKQYLDEVGMRKSFRY